MSLQNDIIVKFKDQPELYIKLNDNQAARDWKALFKKNYQQEFPIFRDQKKYNLDYLNKLAGEAKLNLGWDCETDIKSIDDTVKLHKHLETTLANGFGSILEQYDNLIHELHFCLHKLECVEFTGDSLIRQWLQIEWFNDDGMPLDCMFEHSKSMSFGDIRLQNPYVGHIPFQVYNQNDYKEIFQTCKFHDYIRPGLHIHIGNPPPDIDIEKYTAWWNTHAPEFVACHGIEKILHYTGHPVIGHVVNLEDLEKISTSENIIELQQVIFNE
jgi:hypothetical protein